MPWKLIASPDGYIFTWLVAYSSLLGPIGGIMIAEYYFIRKQQLNVSELYNPNGQYRYNNGYNIFALLALLIDILPNVPGFLLQVKLVNPETFPTWISGIYHYAWFAGFIISGFTYLLMMRAYKTIPEQKQTSYVAVD